jgi:hypothetical protein
MLGKVDGYRRNIVALFERRMELLQFHPWRLITSFRSTKGGSKHDLGKILLTIVHIEYRSNPTIVLVWLEHVNIRKLDGINLKNVSFCTHICLISLPFKSGRSTSNSSLNTANNASDVSKLKPRLHTSVMA